LGITIRLALSIQTFIPLATPYALTNGIYIG
jgi:hypothetical protein